MNELTKKLFEAGYTKDDHPGYVEWTHWDGFEYTHRFLLHTVWETPCGLLKCGIDSYNHGSNMGIDYCPENNNPRFGCPYYNEVDCPHRLETNGLWGWNCAYRFSSKPYNYDMSVEKLWKQWDKVQFKARMEVTEGSYCACMHWDRYNRRYIPEYDVDKCIQARCENEVCVITKRERNLDKVNVFYDILRTYNTRKGLLEINDRKLEKGVKQFPQPVARTDAEMWLKMRKRKEFEPKLNNEDRRNLFYVKYHSLDFTVEVQNVRIEKRESRDLLQDLRDAQEGIEVIHASDALKKAKADKSERRERYKADKKRRKEAREIATWKRILTDNEFAEQYALEKEVDIEFLRKQSESELKKRGIILHQQLSIFSM